MREKEKEKKKFSKWLEILYGHCLLRSAAGPLTAGPRAAAGRVPHPPAKGWVG